MLGLMLFCASCSVVSISSCGCGAVCEIEEVQGYKPLEIESNVSLS
jgi:hypothetical protein